MSEKKYDLLQMGGAKVPPELEEKIEKMMEQLEPVLNAVCNSAMAYFKMPEGTEVRMMLGLAVPVDPFASTLEKAGVQASEAQPEVEIAPLPGSFPVFKKGGRDN